MIKVYKKLIAYVPEKKYMLFLTVLLSLLSALLQIFAFYALYQFLQQVILVQNLQEASYFAKKITLLMIAGALCYFFALSASHLFAFRLETNLRKFGIEGLSRASFRFFDENSSGKIRKLLDDNAAQTHTAVAHLIPDNTGAMLMPFFLLILGFVISLRVGLVLLLLTLISAFLVSRMIGDQKYLKMYREALERLSAESVEYVRGMQVIKIFGVDVRRLKALNTSIKEYAKFSLDYTMSCRTPFVLFQLLFFALIAIILPLAVFFLFPFQNTGFLALELIMLFFLSGVLFSHLMRVMYVQMYVFQANDVVEKLENLYEAMQKDRLEFGQREIFDNYTIEFDDVSFGYTDNMVLEHLSFKLEALKSYALVGPSGSGKTSIAKLISGFYKLNGGTIKIGGVPITDYSEQALIKTIAFVFQEAQLFKCSLFDNVAMARKDASRDAVLEAMHLAGCDSILDKFEERENTLIGTKGVYLSGGEKQRIAIARAILKDAPIVIFDEASAAVDPDQEHELQKAFANLMKGKTVIMIAHRLSSIRNVDEILVLEKGKIIERGSDPELMQKETSYKHFQALYSEANEWRVLDENAN